MTPLVSATSHWTAENEDAAIQGEHAITPNMLGAYGAWAAEALQDPPRLSFRQPMFTDAGAWQPVARSQFHERVMQPGGASTPVPTVLQRSEFEGLSIEHLQWQLPFGPPTEAYFSNRPIPNGNCPAS